jgi:hypothetical protein
MKGPEGFEDFIPVPGAQPDRLSSTANRTEGSQSLPGDVTLVTAWDGIFWRNRCGRHRYDDRRGAAKNQF